MPLVWAHAEYLKLLRSLRDGRVFDLPPQTVQRYLVDKIESSFLFWRFNHKIRSLAAGKSLRIETLFPAVIYWSDDDWQDRQDIPTIDTGLGVHFADLPGIALKRGTTLIFTLFWPEANHWEGNDFEVSIL